MIGFLGEYEATLDSKGRFLLPVGFKKHGQVVRLVVLVVGGRHNCNPPGFITCLARLLNASGEKDSKN